MIRKIKAQEEMVGFVMIMIVVAVIFLIFLTIFIRRDDPLGKTDSAEISQFLTVLLDYTTECGPYAGKYYQIDTLIKRCDEDSGWKCVVGHDTGKTACEVVKENVEDIIEESWDFDPESETVGYEFDLKHESGENVFPDGLYEPYIPCALVRGSRGAEKVLTGDITVSLRICVNEDL